MGTNVSKANYLAEKVMAEIKPRLMHQYKSIKWQNSLRDSVASIAIDDINEVADDSYKKGSDSGVRTATEEFKNFKESVKNHVPAPKTGFGSRMKFLFTGKLS